MDFVRCICSSREHHEHRIGIQLYTSSFIYVHWWNHILWSTDACEMLASRDSDLCPPWPLHKIYPCLQSLPRKNIPRSHSQVRPLEPVTISRHQRRALRPLDFWFTANELKWSTSSRMAFSFRYLLELPTFKRPSGEASMLQGMAVIDYIWPDPKRIHKSMTSRISSTSTKPWDVWRTVYLSNISKCYNLLISNPMLSHRRWPHSVKILISSDHWGDVL